MNTEHPHGNQPVVTGGTSLDDAEQSVIMIHGRGASADSILQLSEQLPQNDTAYLAPQATHREWYPQSFLAPVEQNEPGRTSALQVISGMIDEANDAGIPTDRIALLGFSQGACLAAEYAARYPQHYQGVIVLSGGLIGDTVDKNAFTGDMEQTPVFLGCSDRDPHIPLERVNETAAVFDRLNADVEKRIYDGMGHTINEDELTYIRELLG